MALFRRSLATVSAEAVPLTELPPQLPAPIMRAQEALQPLLPVPLWQRTVQPLLQRLPQWCWALPRPQETTPWGLWQQALERAGAAVVAIHHSTLWWQQVPDLAQRPRALGYWSLGALLAGVCRDVSVLSTLRVTHGEQHWDVLQGPLLAWLEVQAETPCLPTPTLHWAATPTPGAAALMATLMLQPEEWRALTPPVLHDLWGTLVGERRTLLHQLLAPLSPPSDTHGAMARALADQILHALQQCCAQGLLRVNQFPGQVFVHPAATLVTVPQGLNAVRQLLLADGVTLPDDSTVFSWLADAGYLGGRRGQQVQQMVVEPPQRAPRRLSVVSVPHHVLWGAQRPPLYPYPIHFAETLRQEEEHV